MFWKTKKDLFKYRANVLLSVYTIRRFYDYRKHILHKYPNAFAGDVIAKQTINHTEHLVTRVVVIVCNLTHHTMTTVTQSTDWRMNGKTPGFFRPDACLRCIPTTQPCHTHTFRTRLVRPIKAIYSVAFTRSMHEIPELIGFFFFSYFVIHIIIH